MSKSSNTVYFPNLNGVRFIAAFSVLIHHIEQVKEVFKIPHFYDYHLIKSMGKLGVDLFFVLSGFLITYLLLHEKGRFGAINTRDFYIRRILRIWPLYFLIVILAFFVFPHIPFFVAPNNEISFMAHNFYERLSLFLIVLPNIGFILYGSPYLSAQTWSIGVEEQFYYLWPWIIQHLTWKRLLITLTVFSLGTFGVFYVYYHWVGNTFYANNVPEIIRFFFSQFRILTLVTGGGCAMLVYYRKEKILNVLFRKDVQIVVYGLLLFCLATGVHINHVNLEFYGLFFAYFILNVSSNPRSIVNLEYGWISYLGKISYGLYIYQTAFIVLSVHLIQWAFGKDLPHLTFNLILYPLATFLTVGVSALSYHYFEKPFLKLKERFSSHSTTR
ncbi:acyltransferase family protein [Runella sp. CRIBMP]|uniref:Acyltransferase n=1 Tax=Runella aurantiaca TaxID=2282308 RepID=A0A369I2X9_9BACT|nr:MULTISPECIES: acyltransferase [Runella]NBB17992.1 acyltransferase family protein [Runella sp. CRIBMP]RDB03260.1 acyltransferase [Runella aurantiaca]